TASCAGPVAVGINFNTSSAGSQTFTVMATDVAGNSSTLTNTFTDIASATIQVMSALHTVGTGSQPGSVKTPLALNLKVFDAALIATPDAPAYGTIWNGATGLISPPYVNISAPSAIGFGGGTVNQYNI